MNWRKKKHLIIRLLACLNSLAAGFLVQAAEDAPVHKKKINQHDVLPIVLLRCTACHGAQEQMGGLDLRTPKGMQKGGKSGAALIAGKPEASLLIQRIENQACPPSGLLLKYFVQRPSSTELGTLRKWIAAGAPEEPGLADVATTQPDLLVAGEDRKHWAFQPPKAVLEGHTIDGFIAEKLEVNGLSFSPEANRSTLIRRAYLDLIGLPPSLTELNMWSASDDSQWYSKMIDHLLASPHYGERWGRYWLDLAGYADSEGGVSADPVRQVAWKYRDYVIESFNKDKPYDRFLLEQIAGDELIDHANVPEVTGAMVENLVATGFLRMGIDQTGSRTMNFVPERLGVISDALKVLGSGVMGLTLECARCHSHKYDPIPQRDFYRLKAVFQGAFDEHDWLSFKTRTLNVATPQQLKRIKSVNPPLEKKLKALDQQLKEASNTVRLELLRQHYPRQSEDDRAATLTALRKADNTRTLKQRLLVERLQRVEVLPQDGQSKSVQAARLVVSNLEREIAVLQRQLAPPDAIRALWDRGRPSPTYILRRGEHNKPGKLVGPGVPSVLTDGRTPFVVEKPFPEGTPKTGRRLALARWLTQSEHPLTARVLVNRIWHHHFGAGLVRSLENFGVKGEQPSHPKLLDWLAIRFMQDGWSIKTLHRHIMNSRTYRQSSHVRDLHLKTDPQNRLLSHMPIKRMDAEALRDSILFISGSLENQRGGPPDAVRVNRQGLVSVGSTENGRWRRSIYLRYRRTEIPSFMDTFDYPVMGPNCVERNVSTVPTQPLMMMNNAHVRELSATFAARVGKLTRSGDAGDHVELVYRFALSRSPSAVEKQLGISALKKLRQDWDDDSVRALETYCHTILNSAAFLYID
ncbi:MAG: PSD1 and planctomycete cytochrome C domain-containing protein [Verrucomicrobiota bacterium]|nr:PSD1 and planctomycete cytochrome C domain-containing protein [Verrucomicrobiota bacterium]